MALSRPFAWNQTATSIPGCVTLGGPGIDEGISAGQPADWTSNGLYWWAGPDEELGYVIAFGAQSVSRNGANGTESNVWFKRTSVKDASHFIDLANSVTGYSSITMNDVLADLLAGGYWNSFFNGVTNDLVFWLDGSYSDSYSGSGTKWDSLLGTSSNFGTLINSPTWNSQGWFSFNDATFQHATFPNVGSLSAWTVEVLFRASGNLNGKVTSLVTNEFDLVSKLNFSIGTNNAPSSYIICAGFFDSNGWHNTNGFDPVIGQWYHVVGSYDGGTVKFYRNGSMLSSTNYGGTPQTGGNIRIARRWDSTATNAINYFKGDIALVRIYSAALSDDEVRQNYNDVRHRFTLPPP